MLATTTKKTFQYLLSDAVDDLINRGKPYAKYCSDPEDKSYDIVWPTGTPRLSGQDQDILLAAFIREENSWYDYLLDRKVDYMADIQFMLCNALEGKANNVQLGYRLQKVVREAIAPHIEQILDDAIAYQIVGHAEESRERRGEVVAE